MGFGPFLEPASYCFINCALSVLLFWQVKYHDDGDVAKVKVLWKVVSIFDRKSRQVFDVLSE